MTARRDGVPFDPYHFEKLAERGTRLSAAETFRQIYRTNHWGGDDSVSGAGASRRQTRRIEQALPPLLDALGVRTLLDLPCGDFGWMRHVPLPGIAYIGADVVPELVAENQQRYGTATRRFVVLDLTADALPEADLLLCRDALVHLSFEAIFRAFANVRRSAIPYLLTTTFPACTVNEDIVTGDWRVLNLERPPFALPPPLRLLGEECTEGGGRYRDKSLGLWRTADLPLAP
ncbi:MAG: class I SAM-dependent methyltransferase [Rhodothermales bacterium]|nr:class I SAM-dependent methyltransferase [Rhodothermales bacterium]